MNRPAITIKDIEPITPFSRGTTEIFLTGQWSSKKPIHADKTAPCRQGCPIGIDIARAFYYASIGNFNEALRIYREDNPLPSICGRVCYHPCELNCNRKEFDEPLNIRALERFLSDHGKVDLKKEAYTKPRKEKVAVIGSGPAGLSAAYHLARLGYPVTIFEALPEPGGMLRYGIPEYRLPKNILNKEITYIKKLGVKIKTDVHIGKDINLVKLKSEFNAVFIAAGAHGGMRLGIEGEEAKGVIEGARFLRSVNLGEKVKLGKKVVIIGGGNTAIDCARTARRIGGKDITVIYRRSRAEMPALSEDIESMEKEGVKIDFFSAPKKIISRKGKIEKIECVRMKLGSKDSSGRPKPIPIKGSEFIIPADTVISAVGQVPETEFVNDLGVLLNKNGMIEISLETMATNIEGVFAGGDSAGVKAFVADAIASGKKGAMSIYCFLEGKDFKKEFWSHQIGDQQSFSFKHFIDPRNYSIDIKKITPYEKINTLCFVRNKRNNNIELEPEETINNFKEVTVGLARTIMESEISRCFNCGMCTQCDFCFLLCPDMSLKKKKDGYEIKVDYCKGCGICATSCPRNAIDMEGGQ